MKFGDLIIKTKDKMINMLFPEKLKCIFCSRDILNFDSQPYCEECAKKEFFNKGNRCKFCDMKIPAKNCVCDFCKANHKSFDKTFCPLLYQDEVRSAILKFKSDNARYLAYPFALLICKRIMEDDINIDLVIPVPTHDKTRRKRGYNQAELLAKEISKLLKVPYKNDVVSKDKTTHDQKSLPYRERLKNVESCFNLRDKTSILNKNVLIVDDIMTTGSTLNEISKLMKGFAKNIYVCAIARDALK